MPINIKLVLSLCYSLDVFNQILQFLSFTTLISNFISPLKMNQLGIAIENQINNTFYILSKDLYLFIAIVV